MSDGPVSHLPVSHHSPCIPFGDYQLKTVMMTQKRIVMQSKHSYLSKHPTDLPPERQRGILISQRNQSGTLAKYQVMLCDILKKTKVDNRQYKV